MMVDATTHQAFSVRTGVEAAEQTSWLLELRDVRKRFGGVCAIDGVNLRIEQGEIRCLIEPNGSGKSTLFKLITGVHSLDAGEITFAGVRIDGLRPFEIARRGVSLKFQLPTVYSGLSIRQNLRIVLQRQHHTRRAILERMEELLRVTRLDKVGDPEARVLPHGLKQWLEISMAMAMEPKLLLLDEPTAGMTREETRATADIVRQLNEEHAVTVVVIEHDMEFVGYVDRKVTVLHQGRVFFEGRLEAARQDSAVRRVYLGA